MTYYFNGIKKQVLNMTTGVYRQALELYQKRDFERLNTMETRRVN